MFFYTNAQFCTGLYVFVPFAPSLTIAYQGCLLEGFTPYSVRFCKATNHTFRFFYVSLHH